MSTDRVKAVGGLIAVCFGIFAVTVLSVFTIIWIGSGNRDSIVAVSSSALGIISAMVGAYLGIKISAETNAKASEEAKHAAVVKHEADAAQHKSSGMAEKLNALEAENKVSAAIAEEVREAGTEAEEAARTAVPPVGGGAP
ncbi:MAG TPA: hypothetical protein VHA54_04375 [Solirubrobacterales bacterium]|nr:hypothetical protein [Solirubrobacterales bacterium]